jgi:hypothetical protein
MRVYAHGGAGCASGVRPTGCVMNRSSPQALGLRLWVPFVSSFLEFARNQLVTPSGVPGLKPSRLGVCGAFIDTNNDHLSFGATGFVAGLTGWSLSVWFDLPAGHGAGLAGVGRTFYVERGDGSPSNIVKLGTAGDLSADGGLELTIRDDAGTVHRLQDHQGTDSYLDGVPHLAVATYDGTDFRMYVDGLLKNTETWAGTDNFTNTITTWIGSDPNDSGAAVLGNIYDVRAYTRCLSLADVWQMYEPGTRWDLIWTPSTRVYEFLEMVGDAPLPPIALRGSASIPTGNPTTTFTVVVDPAVVAGDLLFLPVSSRDSVGAGTLSVTDDDTGGNAWAKIANSTNHQGTLWYKRATSGTASKTVTVANAVGSCAGVLKAFSGADTGATPYTNILVEDNASADEAAAGFTPDNADSMVCAAICNTNDSAVTSFTFATLGALTSTEKLSTGGSDSAVAFGHVLQTGGPTATGGLSWAQTNAAGVSITWAIKKASASAATPRSPQWWSSIARGRRPRPMSPR